VPRTGRTPCPWTPEDRLLGIALANLIALAIERYERLRAEEALRDSEQRLATLVAYAPDAIAILDVDSFRLIEANEQAARLYGLERNALFELGPVDLSPERQPDGRLSDEAAREKIQEALEGGTPVFEWLHLNASGEPFLCEVRLVRLPHATRRLIRASIIDITERKRLQEKLVEERALLRALIDSIPDYIFVKDTESVYVVCNRRPRNFSTPMRPRLSAVPILISSTPRPPNSSAPAIARSWRLAGRPATRSGSTTRTAADCWWRR